MGKETGFLEYKRKENPYVKVEERIRNFKELHEPLSKEERRKQAAVCMNCGVPFCQSGMTLSGMVTGCPLHNLIPEWNDEIYRGNDAHAFERLFKVNPFPEFTGRVCPALCEKACMCAQYGDAVTIRDNEFFLSEEAFRSGVMQARIPSKRSGNRVAVIGSGPSGLAAAFTVNRHGHEVVVYEREDAIGGLLMYGIPNMKLDKEVLKRRQRLLEEEGISFKTNVNAGKDIKKEALLKEYDAVILCCGAKKARGIDAAQPERAKGVHFAVDYLTAATKALEKGDPAQSAISAKDKHVVIIGGGDTGNDCIGTAVRQGARSVVAIEMMPQPPRERAADNPWPEWPKVEKVDYGHEEAAFVFGKDPRVYSSTVKSVKTDKNGHITSVTICNVGWKDGKLCMAEGSEREIPCGLLLIAAGFVGCEDYVRDAFSLELTGRGTAVTAEDGYRIKDTKLFAAGDMRRGQSLVVWAIREGIACAHEVDAFLNELSQ